MTLRLEDIIKSTWQIGPRPAQARPWQEVEILGALQGTPLTAHELYRQTKGLSKDAIRSWILRLHRQEKIESVGACRWRKA